MVLSDRMMKMVPKQRTKLVNGPDFAQSAAKGPPLHSLKQHADALVNTVSRGVDREAAAFNLTPLEFALIRLLLVDLECTATGLTHMLSVNAPTISRVVSKLVDRGVLHRRRPRKDRRVVLLKLTEEGVALGLELHEIAHSYEERLTRGISAEGQEVFLATIRKIVANHATLERSESDSGGPG